MHWSPMSWFTSKALQVRCGTSAHSPGHPRPLPPLRRSPPGLRRLSAICDSAEGLCRHFRAGCWAVDTPNPLPSPRHLRLSLWTGHRHHITLDGRTLRRGASQRSWRLGSRQSGILPVLRWVYCPRAWRTTTRCTAGLHTLWFGRVLAG